MPVSTGRVEERQGGSSDESPPPGRSPRVEPRLAAGDPDAAGRDLRTRRRQAGRRESVRQAEEVGEPGRETEEGDAVARAGVEGDRLPRREPRPTRDVGEVGRALRAVADRNLDRTGRRRQGEPRRREQRRTARRTASCVVVRGSKTTSSEA